MLLSARLGALVIVILTACPGAAAEGMDTGIMEVDVEVDPEPAAHCTVGIGELCLVTWNKGEGHGPGDDEVHLGRFVDRATVSVTAPGVDRKEIAVDASRLSVEHPAHGIANGSWRRMNDSRPELVQDGVAFESRTFRTNQESPPGGLVIYVRLPAPLPDPEGGTPWASITPAVYSWDCHYYLNMEPGGCVPPWPECSYGSIRPFPAGAGLERSTDAVVESFAHGLVCSRLDPPDLPAPYCVATNVTYEAVQHGAAMWVNATPDVSVGAGVDEVAIEIKPAHPRLTGLPADLASSTGSRRMSLPVPSPAPRAPPDHAPLPPLDTPDKSALQPAPKQVPGEAHVSIGQALSDASPPGASLWLRLVGAAVAVGVALLAALLLGHRFSRDRPMGNENRKRVYEFIQQHPGMTTFKVKTALGLNYQTVFWHLRVLEETRMIVGIGGTQRRFFILCGFLGSHERRKIVATGTPVAKAIVEHVQVHNGATISSIAQALGIPVSTASMAVARLERGGLVLRRKVGRQVQVVPSDSALA